MIFDEFCRLIEIFFQIPALDAEEYYPFVDQMTARYNRVATDEQLQELKRRLKLYGLEWMFEDSKEGVLKTFNSCKLLNIMF